MELKNVIKINVIKINLIKGLSRVLKRQPNLFVIMPDARSVARLYFHHNHFTAIKL